MNMLTCTLCDEPCDVLIDGDFCEACWNGPFIRPTETKV